MGSERDAARADQETVAANDGAAQAGGAALTAALTAARQLEHQLDTAKEANRHNEVRLDKRIEMAPVTIAAVVVLLGFVAFFAAMVAASWYGNHAEFWAKQGERGIGIATAALAYIFGKGSK